MFFAVLATLNLGQAVHEKIRLQNSADSAAYSLAALEARAFNFIALTNRTQIVHYNTAMAVQSYLSYAGFCLGLFGTLRDMIKDAELVGKFGCTTLPPPAKPPFCLVENWMRAIGQVFKQVFNVLSELYDILHDLYAWTAEAMSYFNKYAIWQMQLVRALQINTHLVTGMNDFVKANDPAMTYTAKNQWFNIILNSVLNSVEFQAAFDRGGGLNPFWLDALKNGILQNKIKEFKPNPDDPEYEKAYRVMTEIANASRSHKNIYDRSGGVVSSLLVSSVFGRKMGATKLVEQGDPSPKIDTVHEDGPFNYTVGDTLASDDYMTTGVGFVPAGVVYIVVLPRGVGNIGDGIVADEDGGEHYKYEDPGNSGAAPGGIANLLYVPFPPMGGVKNSYTSSGDQDHDWPGLAPYFKFKPNSEDNTDFNQPSTWMFLNKHHSAFQTGGGAQSKPWHYEIEWNHGGGANTGVNSKGERVGGAEVTGQVSIDTTIGGERNSYLFEGLNVISRGMVYYHRPGTWTEHPNMFNPFWRARLAPVGAKLMNVFDRLLDSKMRTNSDSKIAQGLINIVRGFVSDFFLRVVTAVMTH